MPYFFIHIMPLPTSLTPIQNASFSSVFQGFIQTKPPSVKHPPLTSSSPYSTQHTYGTWQACLCTLVFRAGNFRIPPHIPST